MSPFLVDYLLFFHLATCVARFTCKPRMCCVSVTELLQGNYIVISTKIEYERQKLLCLVIWGRLHEPFGWLMHDVLWHTTCLENYSLNIWYIEFIQLNKFAIVTQASTHSKSWLCLSSHFYIIHEISIVHFSLFSVFTIQNKRVLQQCITLQRLKILTFYFKMRRVYEYVVDTACY